jgi:hypothetical protein
LIFVTQAVKVYLWNLCKARPQKNQGWSLYQWNVSCVVGEVMHAQVTEKVKELSGDVGGSKAFLKYYQLGLSQVVKGLSPSEHAKMQSLATEWEERGAPVDIQHQYIGFSFTCFCCSIVNYRNAEKSGTKFLSNVAKTAFKQFGMQLFLLVSHYNTGGKLMVSLYVYVD